LIHLETFPNIIWYFLIKFKIPSSFNSSSFEYLYGKLIYEYVQSRNKNDVINMINPNDNQIYDNVLNEQYPPSIIT
jgi:hypothetical protein